MKLKIATPCDISQAGRAPDFDCIDIRHVTCFVTPHLHSAQGSASDSERCRPAKARPATKPRCLSSRHSGSNPRRRFMCHAHLRSCSSLVRFNRLRHDRRAHPGFTAVITLLARNKAQSTRDTVLFVGASDAGKTAILSSVSPQFATNSPEG